MADNTSEELHCPWCQAGLGLTEVPDTESAIECPGCQQHFYPESASEEKKGSPASTDEENGEDLDSFLQKKVRGNIPKPRESHRLPTKSGDTGMGWSKWEHSSPAPRKPEFERELRKADDAPNRPAPLIQELASDKKEVPKFSEFGRASHLPEEREIDSEHRRRLGVLQKGWEALSDPAKQNKGPTITKKDKLTFERNLVSTTDKTVEPGELEMRRRSTSARDEKLAWEGRESTESELGDFTVEGMERAQRFRSLVLGMLGACAILAAAVGLFFAVSHMQGEPATTPLSSGTSLAPVSKEFSVSRNYNAIISKVRGFLEAEDVDAMLNTVRNREVVEPLVREYYKTHTYSRRLLREVPSQDSIVVTEGFAVVSCVVGKDEVLWIPMEIAAGLKVDWEAVVGYSQMSWEDFAREKPKTPTLFRASITPVSYYNYGFTEEKFFSIQVSDTKLDHVFYGYIPRRGPLADEFMQLLPEAVGIGMTRDLRAVVELRYPDEEAAANQVEIVSLKARGWVYRRDLRATTQSLELFANDARIDGNGAQLNESFHIIDWEDSSTTVEWRVVIERPVQVSVFANLANGGKRGKRLSLSAGPQRITHDVPHTGGWDAFREVFVGALDFPSPGNYTLRLKHDQRSDETLMVLDRLILRSGDELAGSRVRDSLLKPLVHGMAIFSDERLAGNTLTDQERGAGWRMLFNGKNLKGWTGYRQEKPPKGWSAQAKQLLLIEPGCGPLMSTEEFENFELKLEWQASDGQAGGVFLRVVETKPTPEQTAVEIELNGYGHSSLSAAATTPLTENGAVKHLYAPQKFTPRESGWNELHVRLMKDELQYWINGKEMGTVDRFDIVRPIELHSEDWKRRVDDSRLRRFQQFAKSKRGYIALEDAGTPIRFRNIKVLVLGKEEYRQ